MLYTRAFSHTRKEKPKEAATISHDYLVRGGFIAQEMAGVFIMLPFGQRVLRKIEKIIREEMDAAGGEELLMTNLQAKEHWQTTGRWDSLNILFKVPSRHDREYALGPTAEDIVTPLAKERIKSYRDLPLKVYQIQTKFRDEPRAKSGIIRGREFRMKDLYSFHASETDLNEYYTKMIKVYQKIYKRIGVDAKVVEASGGEFTDKYSHEFMAISEAGEDKIIYCKKCSFAQNVEIAKLKLDDHCPICKGKLAEGKSIEIGNIFKLGTRFSDAFGLNFIDQDGKTKPVTMASYGIGTTRLVGALVELNHDTKGIIWPNRVAPYTAHIVGLNWEDKKVRETALQLHNDLENAGFEVLCDDREEATTGEKLSDADLIGIPARVVISKKTLEHKKFELKMRASKDLKLVPKKQIVQILSDLK